MLRLAALRDEATHLRTVRVVRGSGSTLAARQAVDETCAEASGKARFEARLIVTELVANAILHGAQEPLSPIRIEVGVTPSRLFGSVTNDIGGGGDTRRYAGGRGLGIAATLAARWGAFAQDGRTTVWFEIDRRA